MILRCLSAELDKIASVEIEFLEIMAEMKPKRPITVQIQAKNALARIFIEEETSVQETESKG